MCTDPCSGNPCNGQGCSPQSGHSYICYGCSNDQACPDEQFCDTTARECKNLCPDACPHQLCEIETPHQNKCSGCTDDNACEEGYTCDLTEGSPTINQCIKEACETLVLAQYDNVSVATDKASFKAAIDNSSDIVLVANDIDLTPVIENGRVIDPQYYVHKKLVGPKYFKDIAACKATDTPALSSLNMQSAIFINGEIHNLKMDAIFVRTGETSLVKDVDMSKYTQLSVDENSTLHLEGVSHLYQLDSDEADIQINGEVTLKVAKFNRTTINLASSGKLIYLINKQEFIVDPFTIYHSTFNANGPIIADGPIIKDNRIIVFDSTLSLNADGNIISGAIALRKNATVNIAGSTDIKTSETPLYVVTNWENYGDDTMGYVNITAPLTIEGTPVNTASGELFSDITHVKIDSTVSAGNRYIGTDSGAQRITITKNGEIRGLGCPWCKGDKNDDPFQDAVRSTLMQFDKGAKLEINGVCKAASEASGDNIFDKHNDIRKFNLPCN